MSLVYRLHQSFLQTPVLPTCRPTHTAADYVESSDLAGDLVFVPVFALGGRNPLDCIRGTCWTCGTCFGVTLFGVALFFVASLIASRGVTRLWSGISFTAANYSDGDELWVWQDLSPVFLALNTVYLGLG